MILLLHSFLLLSHWLRLCFLYVTLFITNRLFRFFNRRFSRFFGVEDNKTEFTSTIALTIEWQFYSFNL
jgi:hypothetical protein